MEIKGLSEETMMAEACCGHDFEKKPDLTEEERDIVRAAKVKSIWLKRMMSLGLSAKIAYEGGEAVGFIEYMPIELSNYHRGEDLTIINCICAPHTAPFPDAPKIKRIPGCGNALVKAMIQDVRDKCKGILTPFGFGYTFDMKAFFGKFGFEEFENEGLKMLIKRFGVVQLPSPVRFERKYKCEHVEGKVVVDVVWSSICPIIGPWTLFNVREVCEEFGDEVIVNDICIDDRETLMKYGIERRSRVFFDGKPAEFWGPPEREEIRNKLKETLKAREAHSR